MKLKIVATIIVLALYSLGNLYLTQKTYPNIEADLAIQQIQEDGSREKLRMIQETQNHKDFILGGIVVVCLIGVWGSIIKKSCHRDVIK